MESNLSRKDTYHSRPFPAIRWGLQRDLKYHAEFKIKPIENILNAGAAMVNGSILFQQVKNSKSVYFVEGTVRILLVCKLPAGVILESSHVDSMRQIVHNRFRIGQGRSKMSSNAHALMRESEPTDRDQDKKKEYRKKKR